MANLIGSDVILGLEKKNSILFSDGNVLRVKNKLNLYTLLVKPNFGCSTKEIYSKIRSFSSKNLKRKKANYFKISIILNLKNDLEKIVLKKYPKLQKLKLFMEVKHEQNHHTKRLKVLKKIMYQKFLYTMLQDQTFH